jgi:hypothetical protein
MPKKCGTTQRMLLVTVVLLTALLAACSWLLPDGVRSGMGGGTRINRDESSWRESVLYRIDDHRWITTRGITPCEGLMYYHDSKLGIHTFVGDTGVSGAHTGPFHGYYAIDSSYIAIPATEESSFSGARSVKMYYSLDEGRTFGYFWVNGAGYSEEFSILKGQILYWGKADDSDKTKIYEAYRIDLAHELPITYGNRIDIKKPGDLITLKCHFPPGLPPEKQKCAINEH